MRGPRPASAAGGPSVGPCPPSVSVNTVQLMNDGPFWIIVSGVCWSPLRGKGAEHGSSIISLSDGTRVVDAIRVGVLTRTFPLAKVKAALHSTQRAGIGERAMPAHVTFYYVLALALCRHRRAKMCCAD